MPSPDPVPVRRSDAAASATAGRAGRIDTAGDGRAAPEDALQLARETFLAGGRIEMRTIASALGIGRSTLYRWFGDRDRLIGEVIWREYNDLVDRAEDAADRDGLAGAERILAVVARTNRDISRSRALRRFLTSEPEAALRVLTTKHGGVQPRIVERHARRIRDERERDDIKPDVDATALAYAMVRISEGFLYADQITDTELDLEMADAVMGALLR
ncbi:MAG: TetR/AcrR family transcriptional regulator [Actinobacteria bacterium]|nr:TetR/AcrR family transcriptional regulator [Actinomycetota bacterium]